MNESDKLGDFLVKLIPFIPPIDFTRSLITDDFNILFKHIYEMTHTFFIQFPNSIKIEILVESVIFVFVIL